MILKFNQFIKEELRVNQLDKATLDVLKRNLKDKLIEYKESILSNIKNTGEKPIYIDFQFDRIEKRVMTRELENEFTKDLIKDFEVVQLLDDIEKNMDKKPKNIKSIIRKLFREYFKKLENIKN